MTTDPTVKLVAGAIEAYWDGDQDFDYNECAQAAIEAYEQSERIQELVRAGEAVIERWDSPLWKDQPATADYINNLRKALSQFKTKGE